MCQRSAWVESVERLRELYRKRAVVGVCVCVCVKVRERERERLPLLCLKITNIVSDSDNFRICATPVTK